jgi:hypothetical protein
MAESAASTRNVRPYAWWLVLCLVGLDYFSTLAYLPSVALDGAAELAPLAALGVVVITLLAALPVYAYITGRSTHGQGATGLLEGRVRGWVGKFLILVLLGFVATDFVVTRTLSVSDASIHILKNPFWQAHVDWMSVNRESVRDALPAALQGRFFDFWTEQLVLTVLLSVLAFGLYAFLLRGLTRGFLGLAVGVVALYLVLTGVVVGSGLAYLARHTELLSDWLERVRQASAAPAAPTANLVGALALVALLSFPQMALGLSGFELSMGSVPLVRGRADDDPDAPRGRIRNTRKLLVAAALVMSVLVLGSVLVVTLLVPRASEDVGGPARFRSLAYLAHGGAVAPLSAGTTLSPLFGPWFGTLYDLSATLILCLAGASATISLRDVVPTFLARFGMQLAWAHKVGVVLHLFNVAILVVTVAFRASVSAQQWAYASSVLVLLLSAALAAALDLWARWRGSLWKPVVVAPFLLITGFFLAMVGVLLVRHASGLAIALLFVAIVMVTAFVSRWLRSTELRFQGFAFADEPSRSRWEEIRKLEFQVLVPHHPGHLTLPEKDREIRKRHRLPADVPIIYVEAKLGDPSDFYQAPLMEILRQDGFEVIRVSRCTSIAHVLAAIGLEFRHVGQPPEIHFGWSDESPMAANLNFLFLGEGNVPWMVRELIRKAEPDRTRQPRVVIG